MGKTIISRYFSEDKLNRIKSDFAFLIDRVLQSGYEYDFQLRDNYFNLYYKGNSIGKVSCKPEGSYLVDIRCKFVKDSIRNNFQHQQIKDNLHFIIPPDKLKSFYSVSNIKSMAQKVKQVNFQEEITFEQMLMTDNIDRLDLIIIDRQVRDRKHKTKMDLLALIQKEHEGYQFCVLEVKLGNNPELKGEVIEQLEGYMNRISENFDAYKTCYETNFKQKQLLGLYEKNIKINIVPGVMGIIVVGGYSGIAEKSIKELKRINPEIKVLHLKNRIDLEQVW